MGKNKYYCKIDGVIHNLSDVQDVLDGKSDRNIVLIMYEDHGMDIVSANTFEGVLKFNNNQIPADYNEALKRLQDYNQASIPKTPAGPRCPKCGSTDIKKLQKYADPNIGVSIENYVAFRSYRCNTCRHTW